MAARYNVNGQEMSEEEFQKFQQENGFFNFGQQRKKRWDHKPHLYQCYKDTIPDRWLEISFDDFEYDFHKKPKFLKTINYVQIINNEYIIIESPVVAIFFNHYNDVFLYMKADGLIEEHNCFSTYDDALLAIKKLEEKKCGEHKLFSTSGDLIMKFMPEPQSNDD